MIGTRISHYTILEKLGEGGMSQNCLRALFASNCNFEDPRLTLLDFNHGGQAPSLWRRREL